MSSAGCDEARGEMSYPPVAEGIPVGDVAGGQAAPRVQRQTSEGFLRNLGMPPGINASFLRSNESFPLRIWIIDNSGSMQTTDGKRIMRGPGGREGVCGSSSFSSAYSV